MTTAEIMFAQPGDGTIARKEEARKVLWALLAALFIHLVVAYSLAVLGETFSPAFPVEEKPVELTRSEEHTSELQSLAYLVCRLLLEKKKIKNKYSII